MSKSPKSVNTNAVKKWGPNFVSREDECIRTQPVPNSFVTEAGEFSTCPWRYYWFVYKQDDTGFTRTFIGWAETRSEWQARCEGYEGSQLVEDPSHVADK